jgi:hypothetical protein
VSEEAVKPGIRFLDALDAFARLAMVWIFFCRFVFLSRLLHGAAVLFCPKPNHSETFCAASFSASFHQGDAVDDIAARLPPLVSLQV